MNRITIIEKHKKSRSRDNEKRIKKEWLTMFPFGHEFHFAVKNLGTSHIKNPESQYLD